jgi:hypothetical protein
VASASVETVADQAEAEIHETTAAYTICKSNRLIPWLCDGATKRGRFSQGRPLNQRLPLSTVELCQPGKTME